jgi:hypothetical protein
MEIEMTNELTRFIKQREGFERETFLLEMKMEEISFWCNAHCNYEEERKEWFYKAIALLLPYINESPITILGKLTKILDNLPIEEDGD